MTVISVRGAAALEALPDSATLHVSMRVTAGDSATALVALRTLVEQCVAGLAALGGVGLAPGERVPLAYARGGVTVRELSHWDPATQQEVVTGSVEGVATVSVVVRDWALLPGVQAAVTVGGNPVRLGEVLWQVDADNPGWEQVRALAVRDAVVRAAHYAEAVGVALGDLEHLADAGLLGGSEQGGGHRTWAAAATAGSFDAGVPTLDPQLQQLHAEVEARFSTEGTVALPR